MSPRLNMHERCSGASWMRFVKNPWTDENLRFARQSTRKNVLEDTNCLLRFNQSVSSVFFPRTKYFFAKSIYCNISKEIPENIINLSYTHIDNANRNKLVKLRAHWVKQNNFFSFFKINFDTLWKCKNTKFSWKSKLQ